MKGTVNTAKRVMVDFDGVIREVNECPLYTESGRSGESNNRQLTANKLLY